mmetsp:Transcript_1929/g.4293  ORF Transcript_1929/g.4293 Transcript_1929/m.4293 type:complete len:208 (+) Transcript_1929:697-1320(+)
MIHELTGLARREDGLILITIDRNHHIPLLARGGLPPLALLREGELGRHLGLRINGNALNLKVTPLKARHSILMGQTRDSLLDRPHLFAQLPAQLGKIRHKAQLHPVMLIFLRHDREVPGVQLAQDITLQGSLEPIHHVGPRIPEHNYNSLDRSPQANVSLLPGIPSLFHHCLQSLECLHSLLVDASLIVRRQRQEVDGVRLARHHRV